MQQMWQIPEFDIDGGIGGVSEGEEDKLESDDIVKSTTLGQVALALILYYEISVITQSCTKVPMHWKNIKFLSSRFIQRLQPHFDLLVILYIKHQADFFNLHNKIHFYT